jgi:hypothetical protein
MCVILYVHGDQRTGFGNRSMIITVICLAAVLSVSYGSLMICLLMQQLLFGYRRDRQTDTHTHSIMER